MTLTAEPNDGDLPLGYTSATASLLQQGAEARIFRVRRDGAPDAILKHRFVKRYRNALLDRKLTQQHLAAEIRCTERCRKAGLRTPNIYQVDQQQRTILMELMPGRTLREVITDMQEKMKHQNENESEEKRSVENDTSCRTTVIRGNESTSQPVVISTQDHEQQPQQQMEKRLQEILYALGQLIAKMHKVAQVVHGDLTTSNIMVDETVSSEDVKDRIVFLDFGLASVSKLVEDQAVDLYVLERAFASTHPRSEQYFKQVLRGYRTHDTDKTLSRLDVVRQRGRKRSMVG